MTNRSDSDTVARVALGVFGLAVTAVGTWTFRVVTERAGGLPYGVLAAVIAMTVGSVLVYTSLRPDAVR